MKKFLVVLLISLFCFIPVNAKEEKYKIVSGDIDTVGSEVCFGTECFYVIGNDGNNVKLFSKYNLYAGYNCKSGYKTSCVAYGDEATGIQDSSMSGWIAGSGSDNRNGVVAFTDNIYWNDGTKIYDEYGSSYPIDIYNSNSNLYSYVENYKSYFLNNSVPVIQARLITYDELIDLKCKSGKCTNSYKWLYTSAYWVGSTVGNSVVSMVNTNGLLNYTSFDNQVSFGVRPVIEVPIGYFSEKGIFNGSIVKVSNSDGVISNDDNSVDVIFNDLEQEVKYQTIIYNNTGKALYVNDIDVNNLSYDFIEFKLDKKSENMLVEPGGSSLITFYAKTLVKEGAGKNLNDKININFILGDKALNPNTFSNLLEIILLGLLFVGTVYFICKKKNRKSISIALMICISFGIIYASAADDNSVTLVGNIKYVSQNVMETTGTTIEDGVVDYSNSKDVWTYFDFVKNIEIMSSITEIDEYVKKVDLSVNNDNKVIGYIVENDDKKVPYDLIIMSRGAVIANEDSSFLFSFPNVESIKGLSNIDFSSTKNMKGMFVGNKKLENISIDDIDMGNVTDASYMFFECDNLEVEKDKLNIDEDANVKFMFNTYLYDTIGLDAVSDADKKFGSQNNKVIENGKFIYNESKDDDYPIYYYRGNVTNNNVIFGNYCWKIVRTTETGGTKLLYNGVPVNGVCNNTGEDTEIANVSYNEGGKALANHGYMYGEVIGTKSIGVSVGTIYGNDVKYENGKYILQDTFKSSNGWATDKDTIASKYHYTCASSSSSTCSSVYYITSFNFDTYPVAVTLTGGDTYVDFINKSFSNDNDSIAKSTIDNWFKDNMTIYSSDLEDTVWCNDRSMFGGPLAGKNVDSSINTDTRFNSYKFYYGNNPERPNLECPNIDDSFTVDKKNGNGKLTYPVGLLTASEVIIGGIKDSNSYLNAGTYFWTMTPGYYGNSVYSFHFGAGYNFMLFMHSADKKHSIRPAVSLKNTTLIVDGDGTVNSPYIVKKIEK